MKIGFCGVGNMASAILSSGLSSGVFKAADIIAFNPTLSKLDKFPGICIAKDNREVCEKADLVFLGFKPQKLVEIAREINGHLVGKYVVSLLAGVSIAKLIDALGEINVVRVMPNTPMLIGKGCTTIAHSDIDGEVYSFIVEIFKASGEVIEVEENEINLTIPLSSSSPAFFFRFIKAMIEAGVQNGLSYEVSKSLAISTMHGVSHMMAVSDKSPEELIAQVTSPGGTTLAGLSAFDDFEFEKMIDEAFLRTIKRADELGK